MKNIYVAATGQHVGKTTSTLGLVANLLEQGFKTGYCKPVGQQHITVNGKTADKDAILFAQVIGFEIDPSIHSPVIIGKGVTKEYIDNPDQFSFVENLDFAEAELKKQYELIVYEGTGHTGVGSVVDLSNAQVAKHLNAAVIMVVEGGVGRTIDKLNMCISLFKEENVPLVGVIVNKVAEEKMEEIRYYLEKKFTQMGVPLLGVLPYDKTLSFPIMETVCEAVKGKVIFNEEYINNRVYDIVAGSLVDAEEFSSFRNILLVASIRRLSEALKKIQAIHEEHQLEESPLSGIIVTGDGRHAKWYDEADLNHPYIRQHNIPVITTKLDTYGSVVKVSRIEVKINTRTPWKSRRAIELIRNHVDFELLLERLEAL